MAICFFVKWYPALKNLRIVYFVTKSVCIASSATERYKV